MRRSENRAQDTIKEIEDFLVSNILEVWYPRVVDHFEGGYFTNFSSDWQKEIDQPKRLIAQARCLWTSSKAALRFPMDKRYLDAAEHGFSYLVSAFSDQTEGGFFDIPSSELGAEQSKTAYGNAFAIFALSAYYSLNENPEALKVAKRTFQWLEQSCHDPETLGYFHLPLDQGAKACISNLPRKEHNSTLHILEAFTALHNVWPNQHLKNRIEEIVAIFLAHIISKTGFMHLDFTADWIPISDLDSEDEIILQNPGAQHISFGHDIEACSLLLEAASLSTSDLYNRTLFATRKMLDFSLNNGFDNTNGGFLNGGYYFGNINEVKVFRKNKAWWPQAEGLKTLLMFKQLFPNRSYGELFFKQWEYIKAYIIDHVHGDWYTEGIDANPSARLAPKAHIWKCNYHSSRALMFCIDNLDKTSDRSRIKSRHPEV